ncbi:MAG: glycosyltransferase [Actinomycetota bacterium]|nr:glycosyltransferase [Actinomycetota bacterium]
MGKRPAELRRALDSVLAQRGVELEVVVVGNAWQPAGLPPGVRAVGLPENVGIPAGRNAGVDAVSGDLLFFLDDDAALAADDTLARLAVSFAGHPRLGLVQPRVLDPAGRPPPRRWVPRLRVGSPARSSPAMNVWEGAVAIRREVFEAAGRWPDSFFYAHEGIELAWRVWDLGATVWYVGDVVVHHPVAPPTRHAYFYRLNARNRVWIARRLLPAPLIPVYLGVWIALTLAREHSPSALRGWFAGFLEGLRTPAGPRRPLRWRTVLRMTLHGRPPVI